MLKDHTRRFVNFFHSNGSNKISGIGYITGNSYTDDEGTDFYEIEFQVPGYCLPPFNENSADAPILIYVPECNISEIFANRNNISKSCVHSDSTNKGEIVTLHIGNNSSSQDCLEGWVYSLFSVLGNELFRLKKSKRKVSGFMINIEVEPSDILSDTLDKILTTVFNDESLIAIHLLKANKGYGIFLSYCNARKFVQNPFVTDCVRNLIGGEADCKYIDNILGNI